MASSDPDARVRVFGQPPLVRTLALWGAGSSVAAAICVAAVRFAGWWQDDEALLVLSVAFCLVSLVVSLAILRGSNDRFVVSDEGLLCESPRRPDVFVPWGEIGDVYPENVMQRLVVADRQGRKRLAIEFHLQGYGELRKIILERSQRAS